MGNAIFRTNAVVKLDRPAQPDVQLTEADAENPKKLSVVVTELLRKVATLMRRFSPERRDFEDVVVSGSSGSPKSVRFPHKLGGRVRWYVIDWNSGAVAAPSLRTDTVNTTKDVLVLTCCSTGTLTLRVEEAG